MNKPFAYIFLSFIIGYSLSFCDNNFAQRRVVHEYNNSKTKRPLGAGAFGKVYEFTHEKVTYAVKEIRVRLSDHSLIKLKNKRCGSDESKIAIANAAIAEVDGIIKRSPSVYKNSLPTFKSIYKHFRKVEDLPEFEEKIALDYYAKMKSLIEHLEKEITINKLISTEPDKKTKTFDYKFHFCAQVDGLNYMIFQEKNEYSLNSHYLLDRLKRWRIDERAHFYVDLFKQLHALHELGIVHCDLKEDNVMMKSRYSRAATFIDFGIGEIKSYCNGGTKGYMAPELYKTIPPSKDETLRFKADVFSMGVIVANLEVRREMPDVDVSLSIAKVVSENENDFPNKEHLVFDIVDLLLHITGSMKPSSSETNINEDTLSEFNKKFLECIHGLLNFDMATRWNSKNAYLKFWQLYQLSRLLHDSKDVFERAVNQLDNYLKKNHPLEAKLTELPMETFSLANFDFETTRKEQIIDKRLGEGNQLKTII